MANEHLDFGLAKGQNTEVDCHKVEATHELRIYLLNQFCVVPFILLIGSIVHIGQDLLDNQVVLQHRH